MRVRLANALRDAIRSGRLGPGTTVPSTRILAQDLGLSRGVVVGAYNQLAAEGFIRGRPGAATTVVYLQAAALPARWQSQPPPSRPGPELDLRPGWPGPSAFPRRTWAAAVWRIRPDDYRAPDRRQPGRDERRLGAPDLPRRAYGSQRRLHSHASQHFSLGAS